MIYNPLSDISCLNVLSIDRDWSAAEMSIGTLVEKPTECHPRIFKQRVLGSIAAHMSMSMLCSKFGYQRNDLHLKRTRRAEPIWPAPFVGVLSASEDLSAALVAPSSIVRAVGIDIQKVVTLCQPIAKRIAGPMETSWIEASKEEADLRSLIIMSAKRCYSSALSPFLRAGSRPISYRDIQLSSVGNSEQTIFQAGLRILGKYPAGWPLSNHLFVQISDGYILCITAVLSSK